MTIRNFTGAQRSSVAASRLIVGLAAGLAVFVLAGCQQPVTPEVLGRLPAAQARELQVYSTQHANIFDPRAHSLDTCPYLTYLPHALFSRHDTPEWAAWLHDFYMHKHEEEKSLYGCTCEQELRGPAEPAPPPAK